MMTSHLCNRIPHSALNMETPHKVLYGKDADCSHPRIIGARAFVHIQDVNKLGHTSWEGMVCGVSQNGSNSFRTWNPKTRLVVESRNVAFLEPLHLLPPSRRLSTLQGLEAPSFDFSDNSLDYNYTSREDLIRDVEDYTSALDFSTSTTHNYFFLHKPHPGVLCPGEPHRRGHRLPLYLRLCPRHHRRLHPRHRKQLPRTPIAAPCRPVLRALLHSQVPAPVATDYWPNRNNRILAGLFQKDKLQQLHKQGSHASLNIAHQLDGAAFSTEYAYATTSTQGRGDEGENPETPSRGPWVSHKRRVVNQHQTKSSQAWRSTTFTAGLAPITSVPDGQRVVGAVGT